MRFTIPGLGKGTIPLVAVVVVLAVLPVVGIPQRWLLYLFLFFVYFAIASMWNLHCGYSGLVTLCFPAFIGLGGYTMVIGTWVGIPIPLGMIAGAIVAVLFALLISIPVFRLRGIYFAIGTLVVPEVMKYVFLLWRPVGGKFSGGGAGYVLKGAAAFSTADVYWMALALGIGSIIAMRLILNSRLGLGLAAIRDNDATAASSGVGVFQLKLYSFMIGAFVAGLAGAIFYIHQAYIEPISAFNIRWSMIAIVGAVVGGLRTEEGPIVGTIIVVILHFLLARYPGYSLIIQGAILIGVMLAAPEGIVGLVRRKTRNYQSLLQLAAKR
jgi:branched-chain amino acid transport system permease protein